jgi:spore coat protein U-like protein
VAATPLAFGNYSGTQLDQSSALTVTCSEGTPYAIALGNGSSSGASADQREMTGPNSATLGYTIYSDAAHSSVWGSGTVGTVVNNVGSGLPQNLPAYGRVHSAQAPSPGVYQDTVVVTLTY